MALNKRQTSTVTKVIIIFLAVVFALSITIPFLGLGGDGGTTDGGTAAQGAFENIALQYQPTADAYEATLASDPTSYTVLVSLGNWYYDWANDLQIAQDVPLGSDRPYWLAATTYYERAIAETTGTPDVMTDMAVAFYYGGRTDRAIETIEQVLDAEPEFATALFNAGIFYGASGRIDDSIQAFTDYLALDPEGTSGRPDYAREQIDAMRASVGTGAAQ
jgi:tetratricopeptide (TPR) repeat protein